MVVYRCTAALESIFTAVYQAYEEKRNPKETRLMLSDEPLLFAEDIYVTPQPEKAEKVIRTLIRRFGEQDYKMLCFALSSEDEERAQAVYGTIADGLDRGGKGRAADGQGAAGGCCGCGSLFQNLADRWVQKCYFLARGASREFQHMQGFTRFEELENGVLFSRIGPKNDLLPFLMVHFADRFPQENFAVYDEPRNLFGLHPAGRKWYMLRGDQTQQPLPQTLSAEERQYRELFRTFCRTIAIKERENPKLQQNMLPLRFQEYMVEFR